MEFLQSSNKSTEIFYNFGLDFWIDQSSIQNPAFNENSKIYLFSDAAYLYSLFSYLTSQNSRL
jgi:hypothetical protein